MVGSKYKSKQMRDNSRHDASVHAFFTETGKQGWHLVCYYLYYSCLFDPTIPTYFNFLVAFYTCTTRISVIQKGDMGQSCSEIMGNN